ncbi:MAG: phosphotransferase [Deltaproteobacteria bacterium]|nr:phosphotransferase [Deltaproteobacteria bacterium]
MKALILCAGLGTRLLPHTRCIPKPLFPINGKPLLDRIIQGLIQAGCRSIMINTHHLHRDIEAFLAGQRYAIPIQTRREPRILGTGGAIYNVRDFWDPDPFMVINGDIVTDMDLKAVYDFHRQHASPVTLVLHDFPEINTVSVDANQSIIGFGNDDFVPSTPDLTKLTFTGIQVIDPQVLKWIPDAPSSSSIDFYRTLIKEGMTIRAFIPENCYWKDIGTPRQYQSAVLDLLWPRAFQLAFPDAPAGQASTSRIAGDGSDRLWYRISSARHSMVVADHGIHSRRDIRGECDAFLAIGRHLFDKGISVPRIYQADSFAGLVLVEDIGDVHLQSIVQGSRDEDEILAWYQSAVRLLVSLSVTGGSGFDPSWTYQTPVYDKALIFEKECRYFVEAYLNRYLNLDIHVEDLMDEFITLADRALNGAVNGFMHRDFQSRNLMVKNSRIYAIDFQGGRIGPIQYDLASLLIDPYVDLSQGLQDRILEFCIQELSARIPVDPISFTISYQYCRITRNLQILGAFGYLTRVKGKPGFDAYIPAALRMLNRSLTHILAEQFPQLTRIAGQALQKLERGAS